MQSADGVAVSRTTAPGSLQAPCLLRAGRDRGRIIVGQEGGTRAEIAP
jgi:hypothetical protein